LREKANVTVGDAELHRLAGILDINCHEVKSPVQGIPKGQMCQNQFM